MKTIEEIAKQCAEEIFSDARFGQPSYAWPEPIIANHIKEAIQQERERTCEWVLDGHAVLQFFNTGCGVTRVTRYGKYCDNCGGFVVVKEKGEG